MQKRVLAIALCLLIVSTVAATSAVSAAPAKPSPIPPTIVTYNVYDRAGGQVIGSITINLATGKFNFIGEMTPRYPLSDYKLLLEIQPTTTYEWSTQGHLVSKTTETGSVHINGWVDQVLLHDLQTQTSAGGYGSTWWIVYTYYPF
ncbi:MAG: hypothetical protein ACXVIB_05465 [Halobacteriota archaeon]